MDDPKSYWEEIGRLTGWRLGAYNGMNRAAFYTVQGDEVLLDPNMSSVILSLAVTLQEVSEDFRTLIETVTDLPKITKAKRPNATKEATLLAKSYERRLNALQREHSYLFCEFLEVEE